MGGRYPEDFRRRTLDEHLGIGRDKPVSYLPIDTIERVLGLTVREYRNRIEAHGHKCKIFGADACCIKSGAVYAYSEPDLREVLEEQVNVLSVYGWPVTPDEFIERVATEWVDANKLLLTAIEAAFGDGDWRTVARGTWFYDGVVPMRVRIVAAPARLSSSRYDDNEEIDETIPVPQTPDGNIYRVLVIATFADEFKSLQAARSWADEQPWGPVKWDAGPASG